MVITVKRWFAVALLPSLVTLAATATFAADDWQIVKINGHDYLSVDNIARFYRLPAEVAPSGAKIRLETVMNPFEFVRGSRVIMTREGDYFVPLEVRAQIANAARNSIFVSIHFNATDRDPNATGFEIFSFTPRGAPSTSDEWVTPTALSMQAGSEVDGQSMA